MEPRARRHALREHLSRARAAWERGDRPAALEAVDAALALDPEFLAAHALRDHITHLPAPASAAPTREPPRSAGAHPRHGHHAPTEAAPATASNRAKSDRAPAAAPDPIVSADGWARFEHRARLRRIEKRADAARAAIARRRFAEADAAMADIRVLDPTHPDLISLAIEMEAARRTPTRTTRRGPLAMAALVFVATLLGARWLNDFSTTAPTSSGEVSRSVATPTVPATGPAPPAALVPAVEPPAASIALPSPPAPDMFRSVVEGERPGSDRPTTAASAAPAPTVDASPDQDATPVGTVDRDTRASDDAPAEAEVRMLARPPIQWSPQDGPVTLPAPQVAPAMPPAPAARPTPVEPQHAAAPAASGASGVLLASATRPVAAADEELVQRVLQHYRLAYEALDAGSARTVWPTVNQGALQRAFDGLESQQLTFADCNVQVRDGAGAATCRGTARYVPKVGSRDMHVEPRTWRFTLRKSGEAWQIETARAER